MKELEIIIRGEEQSGKATIGQFLYFILRLLGFKNVEYLGKVPQISIAQSIDSVDKISKQEQKITIKTMLKK